ncbi:MAG: hypothetical protein J6Q13_00375 [Clostridia bacterium]|nr:hypothetical protein [Clostridia bacterium]
MRGQKYWDQKVPLYTDIKEVREERKKGYLNEAKEYYPVLDKIKDEEYQTIKISIKNGDTNARKRLMEVSIAPIIDALAGIYAKYDIEEVVSFEEGLSYVLDRYNKNVNTFDPLPRLWSEYSVSMINYYTFNTITYCYQFSKYNKDNVSIMPKSRMAWEMDKLEHEDFSYRYFVKADVRKRIIEIMSKLETRQARVLALKYGLFDGCEKTFEEIAESENISRSRADQIVIQALRNIRKRKNIKPLLPYQDKDLDLIN